MPDDFASDHFAPDHLEPDQADADHSGADVGLRVLAESGLGHRFIGWQRLTGGVSASVHKLSYETGESEFCDVVVRCHGNVDYARNPQLAADEYALVSALYAAGARVPQPKCLVSSPDILGRPFAIYEYVSGEVISDPRGLARRVPAMARWLAKLHELDLSTLALDVSNRNALQPRQTLVRNSEPPDEEIFEGQIRALLEPIPLSSRTALAMSGVPVVLHGDYWSGNLLWRGDELAAVIDWEDFGVGDALADVACARLELLWATDQTQMERFTRTYIVARGLQSEDIQASLAYWDLCAVLPFAGTMASISDSPAERAEKRVQLGRFVEDAAARLGMTVNPSLGA